MGEEGVRCAFAHTDHGGPGIVGDLAGDRSCWAGESLVFVLGLSHVEGPPLVEVAGVRCEDGFFASVGAGCTEPELFALAEALGDALAVIVLDDLADISRSAVDVLAGVFPPLVALAIAAATIVPARTFDALALARLAGRCGRRVERRRRRRR